MRTYAFIDASNLFYGGEKSLGWKIDYRRLLAYIKQKYGVAQVHYFGGVELHKFTFDYQIHDSVPLKEVEAHIKSLLTDSTIDEAQLLLISRHLKRIRFYSKLESFGYTLHLKPVKLYSNEDGTTRRKANCDVDMTVQILLLRDSYERALILSGDGDFLPVLKLLRSQHKSVVVLARSGRTAKEIRTFAGGDFRDFEYLREITKMRST